MCGDDKELGALPSGRAVAASPSSPQAVSPVPASIPSAFDDGYLAATSDAIALALTWRDENRKAAADAGRHGDKSMRDRLDGSATECHAIAGELLKRAQAIEARRAETGTGSVVDESAVGEADAPVTSRQNISDVLIEALEDARAALHQHYVDWDGEPEDAVPLQLARSKCDDALRQAKGDA